jgi:hypothetical protein
MNWIIFVIVLALFFVLIFKYQNFHGHLSNMILSLTLFFIALSIGYFYITHRPDLSSFDGLVTFLRLYFSWVGTIVLNTGSTVGYAIKQNWTVLNSTIGAG